MPTYEYECAKCGHHFDRFQSMTEVPVKRCPKCRGKVRRVLGGGAGFIFKGSGFYATDYRSSGYRSSAKKDTESGDSVKKKDDSSAVVEKSKPAAAAGKAK